SWAGDVSFLKNVRFWLDIGDLPVNNYPTNKPIDDAQTFVKSLATAGIVPSDNFRYTEFTGEGGGEHNEAGWSTRVDQVLVFLFPPPSATALATPEHVRDVVSDEVVPQ